MKLEELTDIFSLISRGIENIPTRNLTYSIRKKTFSSLFGMVKVAFDTRKIDQETTFIPRRGLQNYHRSEQFVSDAIYAKVQGFTKLNTVLTQIKKYLGKEPEWQDSYVRVLTSAVQRCLRTDQSDEEFSDAQPSMASLAYLEELMFVRYRITPENIVNMSDDKLRDMILRKDELLLRKKSNVESDISSQQLEITLSDVTKFSYEHMMNQILTTMAAIMQHQNITTNSEIINIGSKTTSHHIISGNKINDSNDRTIIITIKG